MLISECVRGKWGKNCSDNCPTGYYGHLCAKTCPCQENCDSVTGCAKEGDIHTFLKLKSFHGNEHCFIYIVLTFDSNKEVSKKFYTKLFFNLDLNSVFFYKPLFSMTRFLRRLLNYLTH